MESSSRRFGLSKSPCTRLSASLNRGSAALQTWIVCSARRRNDFADHDDRFNDILSGFNCPIECLPGYRPCREPHLDNGVGRPRTLCTDSPICGATSQTMAGRRQHCRSRHHGQVQLHHRSRNRVLLHVHNNMIGTGTIRCTTNSRSASAGPTMTAASNVLSNPTMDYARRLQHRGDCALLCD